MAFLERVEELRTAYRYQGSDLLMGLPEMLRGYALFWFRNERDEWNNWEQFCDAFRSQQYLPYGYQRWMRREAENRHQRAHEAFKDYATALRTMMRRAGGFSRTGQIELLYENVRPEYQLYFRIDEVRTLDELCSRASQYEAIQGRIREQRKKELLHSLRPELLLLAMQTAGTLPLQMQASIAKILLTVWERWGADA